MIERQFIVDENHCNVKLFMFNPVGSQLNFISFYAYQGILSFPFLSLIEITTAGV